MKSRHLNGTWLDFYIVDVPGVLFPHLQGSVYTCIGILDIHKSLVDNVNFFVTLYWVSLFQSKGNHGCAETSHNLHCELEIFFNQKYTSKY